MQPEAAVRHATRTDSWEEGVKCQLSVDVVAGVIDGDMLVE